MQLTSEGGLEREGGATDSDSSARTLKGKIDSLTSLKAVVDDTVEPRDAYGDPPHGVSDWYVHCHARDMEYRHARHVPIP